MWTRNDMWTRSLRKEGRIACVDRSRTDTTSPAVGTRIREFSIYLDSSGH